MCFEQFNPIGFAIFILLEILILHEEHFQHSFTIDHLDNVFRVRYEYGLHSLVFVVDGLEDHGHKLLYKAKVRRRTFSFFLGKPIYINVYKGELR